ncbi:MAG: protein tyrosine phosphatase family protein [Chloroflexota bacterium]
MIQDIYNYLELNDHLLTAGQPRQEQLADIAAAGCQAVINLAMPDADYALEDERGSVQALGMAYYPLPVVWQNPTLDDLLAFCNLMDRLQGSKLFVHCAANMRVSAFVALYRVLRLGWEPERAFEDTRRIWTPDGWWKEFIDQALANRAFFARPPA